MCFQGALLVNDHAASIVDRYLAFREGVAFGIDRLLEPPGLGAFCDSLENRTTYVSSSSSLGPSEPQGLLSEAVVTRSLVSPLRDAVDRASDSHGAPSSTRTR